MRLMGSSARSLRELLSNARAALQSAGTKLIGGRYRQRGAVGDLIGLLAEPRRRRDGESRVLQMILSLLLLPSPLMMISNGAKQILW